MFVKTTHSVALRRSCARVPAQHFARRRRACRGTCMGLRPVYYFYFLFSPTAHFSLFILCTCRGASTLCVPTSCINNANDCVEWWKVKNLIGAWQLKRRRKRRERTDNGNGGDDDEDDRLLGVVLTPGSRTSGTARGCSLSAARSGLKQGKKKDGWNRG